MRGLENPSPVKQRAGVSLASRCDVRMPCDITHRQSNRKRADQFDEHPILSIGESTTPITFEFDANRMIIAAHPTPVTRGSGMPGPILNGNELQQFARAADEKMR